MMSSVTERLKAIKNESGSDDERDALKHCRTLIEAESEASKDIQEAQAHLEQNVLARYAAVARPRFWTAPAADFSAVARRQPPPLGVRSCPDLGSSKPRLSAPAPLFGANVSLGNRD